MKEQRTRTKAAGNFQSIGALALQVATLLEQLRGISAARITVETGILDIVFTVGFPEVLVTGLAIVIAVMVWNSRKQNEGATEGRGIPVVEAEPEPGR